MEKGEEQLPTLDLKDGNIQGTTDKSSTSGVSDDIETLFFGAKENKPSTESTPKEEKKSLFEVEQTNNDVIDTTNTVEKKNNEPKKEETSKEEVKKEEPKKAEAPKEEVKKEEPKKAEAPKEEVKKPEPQNGEVKKSVLPQKGKPTGPIKPQSGKPQAPNKPPQGGKPLAPQGAKPVQGNNGKPPEKLTGKPVPPPTGKPQAPVFEKESSAPGVPISRAVIAERERKAKREAELAAQEARRILEEKKKAEEEARLKAEEERKAAAEAKKAAETTALEPPKGEEIKNETPAPDNQNGSGSTGTGSIFEPGAQPKQNEEIIDTTGTAQPNLQVTQPISIPIDPNNNGPIYVMIQNPGNIVPNGAIGGIAPQNITIQPAVQNNQQVPQNGEPTLQSVQQPNTGTKNEGLGSYKLNSSLLNKLSSDENLLKEYIGNNYYKLSKGIINFAAFFFNSIYLLFRKMPLFALIVFALELVAICIINQPLVLLGVFLVLAVLFNKVYMVKSKKAIKRLRMKYADQYVLRRMCAKRGGTNFGFALVGIIFEVAAIFVLIFYGYGRSITKYLANFGIDISITDVILKVPLFSEGSEEPSSYNGIIIVDTDVKILDELNIGVARSFKPTVYNNAYRLSYNYSDNTKRINKCSLKLVSVKKYNSSETLISQIAKHYGSTPDEIKNGWNNVKVTTKRGVTYYYSINKEDKVYLFTYDEENNAPQDCDSYREEVFSTIVFKDKMIEEETETVEQQKVSN